MIAEAEAEVEEGDVVTQAEAEEIGFIKQDQTAP